MEIVSQAMINTSASSNASTASNSNGNMTAANALSGQTTTDFSTALNGMLIGFPAENQPNPQLTLAGLNALFQLMTALNGKTGISEQQQPQDTLKQLHDELLKLLDSKTEDASVLLSNPVVQAGISEKQQTQDTLKQLDELLKLMDSNTEDASALLSNPDVQAWLAQLQALMMTQSHQVDSQVQTQDVPAEAVTTVETVVISDLKSTPNNVSASGLNPLLFVPLANNTTPAASSEGHDAQQMNPVTKAEAHNLLESFKQLLLQAGNGQGAENQFAQPLQKLASELQQVLAPYVSVPARKDNQTKAATEGEGTHLQFVTKSVDRSDIVPLKVSLNSEQKPVKSDTSVQVQVTTVNSKLEYLAAKSLQPAIIVENQSQTADGPLFEPLVDMPVDVAGQNNAMPMHEFLKQVQSGEPLVKMPVLMMQAPTFVEDMTQFVIKSFTMDVRAEGITEAKLSLYPQHLGQVDVKLTMHNGQLIAQFVAESSVGREMLESQLSQLRTTLQSQGIQVDKLEVTQSQSFQSGLFQEQRQQSQQSNKQQKSNGTSKVVSLDEELAQETEKTSQVSNGAGLTSIDTTA